MLVRLSPSVRLVRLVQVWNALTPMLLTPAAIVTRATFVHNSNAPTPMLTTLSGSETAARLLQPKNAPSPRLATLLPIVDARQVAALAERIGLDGYDAIADDGLGQAPAPAKRPNPYAHDVVGNCDAGQGAAGKRPLPDARDAVGDGNAGQAAPDERTVCDAGHRQAIDHAGDGHRTARTGVTRDRDYAVSGRVIEVGLLDISACGYGG